MNNQRPYYATEAYLQELQSTLRIMESIGRDTTTIKRAIETTSLQVSTFAQMDENNKNFNQLVQSLKK